MVTSARINRKSAYVYCTFIKDPYLQCMRHNHTAGGRNPVHTYATTTLQFGAPPQVQVAAAPTPGLVLKSWKSSHDSARKGD